MYFIKTCMTDSQRRMKNTVERCIYVQQYYLHKMGRMSAISFCLVCDWIFNTPITLCLSYQGVYVTDGPISHISFKHGRLARQFSLSKVLILVHIVCTLFKYADGVLFKAIINNNGNKFVLFRIYVLHNNLCGVIVWCPTYRQISISSVIFFLFLIIWNVNLQ